MLGSTMTTDELLTTLQQLETELHQEETRRNASRMAVLLHPEFQEFGRSGRRYSRAEVLAEFSGSDVEFPTVVSWGFSIAICAEHIALLTYVTAHKDESGHVHRHTLRSSLWLRTSEGWKIRFHQGTPTTENEQSAT